VVGPPLTHGEAVQTPYGRQGTTGRSCTQRRMVLITLPERAQELRHVSGPHPGRGSDTDPGQMGVVAAQIPPVGRERVLRQRPLDTHVVQEGHAHPRQGAAALLLLLLLESAGLAHPVISSRKEEKSSADAMCAARMPITVAPLSKRPCRTHCAASARGTHSATRCASSCSRTNPFSSSGTFDRSRARKTWMRSSEKPGLGKKEGSSCQVRAHHPASSTSSRCAVAKGVSPSTSRMPAGSSHSGCSVACRYWRCSRTLPHSSRASAAAAPGCCM